MNILITGANGFIGQSLCQHIANQSSSIKQVIATVRHPNHLSHHFLPSQISQHVVPSLEDLAQSETLLKGVNCIIHTAARVHQMNDRVADPLAEFRKINTYATEHLAYSASQAGVQRLVYLSSIKVNGEENSPDNIYSETSTPNPQDPYGISKLEAEIKLREVSDNTGLEVVIIRPPLVYGPQVKANFLKLLEIINRELTLPLGGLMNRRSFVYVENLSDAILKSITHPAAKNQTFLISDGQDISTTNLIKQIAQSFNKNPNLLSVPPKFLSLVGLLTGKSDTIDRLTGSLVVDSSKIRQTLHWNPPYTFQEGIQKTCDWYLQSH